MYYEKEGDQVRCNLCPHECLVTKGKKGRCRVRKNVDGKLVTLVYSMPAAVNIDPIEKKPLYHFLPDSKTFSIGTLGCNLSCKNCQNFDISFGEPGDKNIQEIGPKKVVELALENNCTSISYTYNEPTIFFEYALDCAKLAKQKGLKNIIVTNGFINPGPAKEWLKYIDGANVDLKAFDEKFYEKVCGASLQPILDTLKLYKKHLWLEITNLIIDGMNDDLGQIEKMCIWIRKNLGKNTPLHFSRAFPMFKMQDISPTPIDTLKKAKKMADKYLDYVYIGNTSMASDTYCKICKKTIISRNKYDVKLDLCSHFVGVLD